LIKKLENNFKIKKQNQLPKDLEKFQECKIAIRKIAAKSDFYSFLKIIHLYYILIVFYK